MKPGGFTLVEVLVAMVLAGLGVATAFGIFAVVGDGVRALERNSRLDQRRANARLWMAEAFMSAEVDGDRASFIGSRDSVVLSGWQWNSDGWVVPSRIAIGTKDGALRAELGGGSSLLLADAVQGVEWAYLGQHGADAVWLPEWRSDAVLPVAVRLIVDRGTDRADTMLVLVGPGA